MSARRLIDRTVRVANQRNFARTVMAVSSVVVAVCAVAVTIKVMSSDIVSVEQPRVLDQAALERQVTDEIRSIEGGPVEALACPTSVVVEVGNQVECRYWGDPNPGDVRVEVVSDQGEISVEIID